MAEHGYRRTPLPASVQPRLGAVFASLAAMLACPFIGFAIVGRVEEAGLVLGLQLALLPSAVLAVLAWRHRRGRRRLPPALAAEWVQGRIVPATGGPPVAAPWRCARGRDWIEVRPDGVLVSRHVLLGTPGAADAMAKLWLAGEVGEFFVEWDAFGEWCVEEDDDGPDRHVLPLRAGGRVYLRRFGTVADEVGLLDAVRSIGGRPVRLRCDVEPA